MAVLFSSHADSSLATEIRVRAAAYAAVLFRCHGRSERDVLPPPLRRSHKGDSWIAPKPHAPFGLLQVLQVDWQQPYQRPLTYLVQALQRADGCQRIREPFFLHWEVDRVLQSYPEQQVEPGTEPLLD